MQRKSQAGAAGVGLLRLRAAPQQQKPGAIARLIIDGIGQLSHTLLLPRLA